ncbi:MAG: phosphodiester glycosidase family protein [Pseudomonadota bacterium]|nr:phosphodiester glycosidase family protein [Pseudomonadota bacterium]
MKLAWLALAGLATACSPPKPAVASACTAIEFEGARFTDCRADPAHDRIALVIDPQRRTLAALAQSLGPAVDKVRFAMNGGMYDDKGLAIGLAISQARRLHALNRRRGAGNFHLLPNGVFSVEADGWHVRTTDAFAALPGLLPELATQSGPMLVIAGRLHPAIAPDGDSLYVRNAVGIDRAGNVHFVISNEAVSFGKLVRLFRDRLGCADALFLDGSVSALWDPASDRLDSTVPLGPLLLVERR